MTGKSESDNGGEHLEKGGGMLRDRVAKARKIVEFGLVKQMNSRAWLVPGSDGKRYLVTRRKGEARFRCDLETGNGLLSCPGNSNGQICYHVLQAIIAATKAKSGKNVSFCSNKKDAQRREEYLKTSQGHRFLKIRLKEFLI